MSDLLQTVSPWLETLAALMVLLGAFFLLVGAVGLVRLPSFFMRLHAPTKASTLGVGGVLLASMLVSTAQGRPSVAELLITLLVFITAPVSANLMAQAALHLGLAEPPLAKAKPEVETEAVAADDAPAQPVNSPPPKVSE